MLALTSLPPLALYIHVPWCVRKCPYCDFNSHKAPSELPEQDYVDALLKDLSEQLPQVWGRRLSSIFIGGGTPSLLSGEQMSRLLSNIRALLPFNHDIEITLEANPGTAEANKFAEFFQAGVNRLSIGIQSFNDEHLKALGRIHSSAEALKAIEYAHAAGFERINLDLMHGLPGQSAKQAEQDIQTALQQGTEHLSWYQLTLEPNTLFYAQPPQLPQDDTLIDIQEVGEALLSDGGFERYEVSAYSKTPSARSRHNLNYWNFGDYLAIGAGAHGKITLPADGQIIRYNQYRNPKDYLDSGKPFTRERLAIVERELPLEFMMNALRLLLPVPKRFFTERTGLPLEVIRKPLDHAISKGLVAESEQTIQVTEVGTNYLNDLLALFMPDQVKLAEPINIINLS